MGSLVIVESPAKAKTIEKILGKGFSVKASVGHIKDLPKKRIGVDIGHDFTPEYEIIPGKEKTISELRAAAKRADKIYLAPDPDREGEAIAYHIATEISQRKDLNGKIFRISFNEITERAVKEAIKSPGKIDMNKVNAQQARRILDRLVGYELSPLLWKKIRRGLSAGRVQSVAVRLIVEREREIEAFKSQEYWMIGAELEGSIPPSFQARLYKIGERLVVDREKEDGFLLKNKEDAVSASEAIKNRDFILSEIEKKNKRRLPSPPFITSTLQQEASRKLGFSAKKTMTLAQQLYEGIDLGEEGSQGLITYMRTDSVRVSKEAQEWARGLIKETFGEQYLPERPPEYKSRSSAQEAHEAIRPTSPRPPHSVRQYLSKDQYNLYNLIWQRFISSQMSPALLEQTTFSITAGDALFRASGSIVKFDGFMAVYKEGTDEIAEEEGALLPNLKKGERLKLLSIKESQHFTQPPPRYTEASLVKALEEKGIGRPSTYATILSTIVDRKYVQKTDGRLQPTELGTIVNDLLTERFPELIDIGFTARMEKELDSIEEGRLKWVKVIKDFYKPFKKDLEEAEKNLGRVKPADIPTEEVCGNCGLPMVIKWGRHGRFLACTGYPGCKTTKPLEESPVPEPTDEVCPKCGAPMVVKSGRFGKFLACSRYPECKTTKPLSVGVKCPLDGGDIVQRRSKKGKPFFSCSNYPKCKFATWYKPIPETCPKCGAGLLLEKKDKLGNIIKLCHKKECGFKAEIKKSEDAA